MIIPNSVADLMRRSAVFFDNPVSIINLFLVFRTFMQHPPNYLTINISFVFLGVALIFLCLSERSRIGLGVLVFRLLASQAAFIA